MRLTLTNVRVILSFYFFMYCLCFLVLAGEIDAELYIKNNDPIESVKDNVDAKKNKVDVKTDIQTHPKLSTIKNENIIKEGVDLFIQQEIIKVGTYMNKNVSMEDFIKQEATYTSTQYIKDSINKQANKIMGSYGKLELDIDFSKNIGINNYNIEYVIPFKNQISHQIFLQMGALRWQNRDLIHIGGAIRFLTYPQIIGINTFVDGDITTGHSRYSLGLEFADDQYLIRTNYYDAISKEISINLSNKSIYDTKPASGFDINAATTLFPQYGIIGELKYYRWFGKNIYINNQSYKEIYPYYLKDDIDGWDTTLNWQPFPLFSASMSIASTKEHRKAKLISSVTFLWQLDQTIKNQLMPISTSENMKTNLLQYFIKREHKIVLSYLTKKTEKTIITLPEKINTFEGDTVSIKALIINNDPIISYSWIGSASSHLQTNPKNTFKYQTTFYIKKINNNQEQYDLQLEIIDQKNRHFISNILHIIVNKKTILNLYKDVAKTKSVTQFDIIKDSKIKQTIYWDIAYNDKTKVNSYNFIQWHDNDNILSDTNIINPEINNNLIAKLYTPKLIVLLQGSNDENTYSVPINITEKINLHLYEDVTNSKEVTQYNITKNSQTTQKIYWQLLNNSKNVITHNFSRWIDNDGVISNTSIPNPSINSNISEKLYNPKLAVILQGDTTESTYEAPINIVAKSSLHLYKDLPKKIEVKNYVLEENSKIIQSIYWELLHPDKTVSAYNFVRWLDNNGILTDTTTPNPDINTNKTPALYNPQLIVQLKDLNKEFSYSVPIKIEQQIGAKSIKADSSVLERSDVIVRIEAIHLDPNNAVITVADTNNTTLNVDSKFTYKGQSIYEGKIYTIPWGMFIIYPVIDGIKNTKLTANIDTYKLYSVENRYLPSMGRYTAQNYSYNESAKITDFARGALDNNNYTTAVGLIEEQTDYQNRTMTVLGNTLAESFNNIGSYMISGISIMLDDGVAKNEKTIHLEVNNSSGTCVERNNFGISNGNANDFITHFTTRTWNQTCRFNNPDDFTFVVNKYCNDRGYDRGVGVELLTKDNNSGNISKANIVESSSNLISSVITMKIRIQAFKVGLKCYRK